MKITSGVETLYTFRATAVLETPIQVTPTRSQRRFQISEIRLVSKTADPATSPVDGYLNEYFTAQNIRKDGSVGAAKGYVSTWDLDEQAKTKVRRIKETLKAEMVRNWDEMHRND